MDATRMPKEAITVRAKKWFFKYKLSLIGFILTLPALVYFMWWIFIPMLYGVWLSFMQTSLIGKTTFSGLTNYLETFKSTQFWESVVRTIVYTAETVVPTVAFAFFMAWLIHLVPKGKFIFVMAFFIPFVVPTVASAVVFELLFQPYSLLNQVLNLKIAWLTDPSYAMIALSIVTIWNLVGYYVVIFLAGLQQVPNDLLEAGKMDGTTSFQTLRYIVLPLLKPTFLFAVVTSTANVLTNFTQPYIMTKGGPAEATLVMPLLIYDHAFRYSNLGVASAMATVLLLVSLLLVLAQFRLLGERESDRA